jgi:hypothetical protein
MRNPTGKGERLIIFHIVSDGGYLEGGNLLFESKKTGYYPKDMNGEVFQKWFRNILPKLYPRNVIVMDKALSHSVKLDRPQNKTWRKQVFIDWLTN